MTEISKMWKPCLISRILTCTHCLPFFKKALGVFSENSIIHLEDNFWDGSARVTVPRRLFFAAPTENSHHLKSWILSKAALFHNEKEWKRIRARCQVSLEKSSKNYSRCENEPSQAKCIASPISQSIGGFFWRVFHVVEQNPPDKCATATRHGESPLLGERAGWSAVWYNSITDW